MGVTLAQFIISHSQIKVIEMITFPITYSVCTTVSTSNGMKNIFKGINTLLTSSTSITFTSFVTTMKEIK